MEYDWFIDTDPEVIELMKRGWLKGFIKGYIEGYIEELAKGKLEGELKALRRMALNVVQARFPTLVAFAQTQVNGITQPAQLDKLVLDLMQASDRVAAIDLLTGAENGQRA